MMSWKSRTIEAIELHTKDIEGHKQSRPRRTSERTKKPKKMADKKKDNVFVVGTPDTHARTKNAKLKTYSKCGKRPFCGGMQINNDNE